MCLEYFMVVCERASKSTTVNIYIERRSVNLLIGKNCFFVEIDVGVVVLKLFFFAYLYLLLFLLMRFSARNFYFFSFVVFGGDFFPSSSSHFIFVSSDKARMFALSTFVLTLIYYCAVC